MKLSSLEAIAAALKDADVRYLIVGGLADAELRQSWIRDKGMIVFQLHSDRHPETRIDLFVQEPFDFDREYDQALIGELLPGLQTRFVCLDTLIRMKETAGARKGSRGHQAAQASATGRQR